MILLDTNVISEPQRRNPNVRVLDWLDAQGLLSMFANRVLPFDMACTKAYAGRLATSRAAGQAVEMADAFIAAVALANGFAVATRDTTPFEAAGLNVINPWEAKQ